MAKQVLAADLGGTKLALGMILSKGRLRAIREAPTRLDDGWPGLRDQLLGLCRELEREAGPALAFGIGSAGPLHAPHGLLLDPTNFGWNAARPIPIAAELQRRLRIPVALENDAAAALLGERWKGGAGRNSLVLTLGTGLGLGVSCNGRQLRGGRQLHPEGGHILLRPGDRSAPCGCGNFGCAEAFLSGSGFARRAAKLLGERLQDGALLEARARRGERRVKALFSEYAELLGDYLHDLVVLFYPEEILLSGSFSRAHPLFLPEAKRRLKRLLQRRLRTVPLLPVVRVSALDGRSGLLGAAFLAFQRLSGRSPE